MSARRAACARPLPIEQLRYMLLGLTITLSVVATAVVIPKYAYFTGKN